MQVTNTVLDATGSPAQAQVKIELLGAQSGYGSSGTVEAVYSGETVAGVWTADLVPNANLTPANTRYRVTEQIGYDVRRHIIIVPTTGTEPLAMKDLLATAPGALDPPGLVNQAAADITGTLALSGDITPPQITNTLTNDYNPTGLSTASVLRISTDAERVIKGLAGGADGRIIVIHNVGSFPLTLGDERETSLAANRFALSNEPFIYPDQAFALRYDSTSSRWRPLSATPDGLGSIYHYVDSYIRGGRDGTSLKAARADHRHSLPHYWYPAPAGDGSLDASDTWWESYPVNAGAPYEDLGVVTEDGVLQYVLMAHPGDESVNRIILRSGATALSGCSHLWVVCWDYHGPSAQQLLAVSADEPGATWPADTDKVFTVPRFDHRAPHLFVGIGIEATQHMSLMGRRIQFPSLGSTGHALEGPYTTPDQAPDPLGQVYYSTTANDTANWHVRVGWVEATSVQRLWGMGWSTASGEEVPAL